MFVFILSPECDLNNHKIMIFIHFFVVYLYFFSVSAKFRNIHKGISIFGANRSLYYIIALFRLLNPSQWQLTNFIKSWYILFIPWRNPAAILYDCVTSFNYLPGAYRIPALPYLYRATRFFIAAIHSKD